MKTEKQYKIYLHKIIEKFIPILLLQKHIFEIERLKEENGSYFECKFNYPYLNVTIYFSNKSFEDWKKNKDMIPFVVHEMCHPITDPLYSKAIDRWASNTEIRDERERLTDYICNIVLRSSSKEVK